VYASTTLNTPDRSSARHRIMREIQRPILIRRNPRQQRLSLKRPVLALLPSDPQSASQ
jgi:hypothetical protein